ncbi:MFS transporter [Erwinia amylovora]|uniref:MFS transporter n=4 Tax=Erwinia amylovora TaxID=552 RepID=A0ABX7MKM9_ERWAM|nr:MFS transporter [Erwinia amylovora]CBX79285.1 putative MFS citrate transporter citA [Erwinia amylovora ATCC BAA-2158]CCP01767.1 putative MFS citrate transporter citA [Erwinia amylovora Ea644]CDK14075.1 putative MFS citrate transporter citA [Erwinia amylovora LA635]CDK17442.1 putative MFS citrate transporter citA [Erwinia amylovora LA636]CDK20811.1 putative MFS citrate transporter citA [Erwinia amylovora LA637]
MTSHVTQPVSRQSGARRIFNVTSGNFLEMYDFMVFGYYATAIAKTFFPGDDPFASLMLTLMTFGAGFLMRPLGAIILGSYIDRHGRRKGLLLTLGLMALGTLSIAITPGYSTLGMAAPIMILLGRLLQGFSAGVELGGVSVYLSEIAPKGRKGFYVSWQSASQQIAVIFAALLGLMLNHLLDKGEVTDWGWRVPFLIGCLIVPFLFWIRRMLEETEAFSQRKHHPSMRQIVHSVGRNWALVLAGMLMVVTTTVMFYMITAYTPTFGKTVLMISDKQSFLVTLCVGISNLFWLPVMGSLSDRIGRRPLLLLFTVLMIATAWPVLNWLVGSPSLTHLLLAELWLSFLYGSYNGAMVVYLAEVMPAEVRATGFSLAYSLATALFGGFTPAVCSYLIHVTGDKAMPGVWLSFAAVCGLLGTLIIKRLVKQYQARRLMEPAIQLP